MRLPQKSPPGYDVIQPHTAQGTSIISLRYYLIERNATVRAHNYVREVSAEFFGEMSINTS